MFIFLVVLFENLHTGLFFKVDKCLPSYTSAIIGRWVFSGSGSRSMPGQSRYVFRNWKLVTESCSVEYRRVGLITKDVAIVKNDFFGRITCAGRLGRGRSCGRGRGELFGRRVPSVQARTKHHFPQRPKEITYGE